MCACQGITLVFSRDLNQAGKMPRVLRQALKIKRRTQASSGICDAGREDEAGGLYRTQDGGKNWERIGREGRQTFGGYFHPNHEKLDLYDFDRRSAGSRFVVEQRQRTNLASIQ